MIITATVLKHKTLYVIGKIGNSFFMQQHRLMAPALGNQTA